MMAYLAKVHLSITLFMVGKTSPLCKRILEILSYLNPYVGSMAISKKNQTFFLVTLETQNTVNGGINYTKTTYIPLALLFIYSNNHPSMKDQGFGTPMNGLKHYLTSLLNFFLSYLKSVSLCF